MSYADITLIYVASYAAGIIAVGTFREIGRPVPRPILAAFAGFFFPLVFASFLVIRAVERRQ